jgi:hypothetical protein
MRHFDAAPWPTSLKVTSTLGGLLLIGVGYGAWRAVPPSGFAHTFGSAIACVMPVIALWSVLFVVLGYDVAPGRLYVRRLLWSTTIPLDALESARYDPAAIKCALRVFGNGGLFSFTGVYQNAELGRFRLFATDPKSPVVLRCRGRVVVVTPAAPHAFAEHVMEQVTGAREAPRHAHG